MGKIKDFFKSPVGKSAIILLLIFAVLQIADQKDSKKNSKNKITNKDRFLTDDESESFDVSKFKNNNKFSSNKKEGQIENDKPIYERESFEKALQDETAKTQSTDPKIPRNVNQTYTDPDDVLRLRDELALLEKKHQELLASLKAAQNKESGFVASPSNLGSYKAPLAKNELFQSERYAPYGRLIKCMLVNTVDSSNLSSPIIAVTADDVYHNGKLILPAGLEVHGRAASEHLRDRIGTSNDWLFVWRTKDIDNGKELAVKGIALDYAYDSRTGRYGPTDGSTGLRGQVIESDNYQQLKLYAMTFISGAAEGFFETIQAQNTDTSEIDNGNDQNRVDNDQQIRAGAASGIENATRLYADRILEEIEENGSYVRVAGGTYFYLYLDETLNVSNAKIGASVINHYNAIKEAQALSQSNNGGQLPTVPNVSEILNQRLNERDEIKNAIKSRTLK